MKLWVGPHSRRSFRPCILRRSCAHALKHTTAKDNRKSEEGEDYSIGQLTFPDIEVEAAANHTIESWVSASEDAGNGGEEYDIPGVNSEDVHPPFAKAFTKIDGSVRTHRFRRYGNKPLPLPPVIDPVYVAARHKWKMKKSPPPLPEEMTEFQKKLYKNPYAKALATPVRNAAASSTHLPRFFLFSLDLQRSPNPPHDLTLVPSKLWSESLSKPSKVIRGPQMYVELLQAQTRHFDRRKAHHLFALRASFGSSFTRQLRKKVRMRERLSEYILKLLRSAVVKSLAWCFKHPNTGLVLRCDGGAHAAREIENVTCVIYTGPMYGPTYHALRERVNREIAASKRAETHTRMVQERQYGSLGSNNIPRAPRLAPLLNPAVAYPPFEYPLATNAAGEPIPVYSLTDLLGEEKTDELLKGTEFEDIDCVVLIEDDRNVKSHMALMRLENFLSVDTHPTLHGPRGQREVRKVDKEEEEEKEEGKEEGKEESVDVETGA